jgi:SWI/SNF-related matrix-associated actin-dependent regulator 1 of chromatin subfamily A
LAKAQPVAELVRDELAGGEGKVIVFGLHPDVLRGIAERIGPAAVVLDGRCTHTERTRAIQSFQRDDKVRVFCGQLYAAGTGLNLQVADRVIFAEAAWTPAVNEQGIARAYRAGQRRNVRVSFVALRGSIDEQVQGALARKARLISQIIEKGEGK